MILSKTQSTINKEEIAAKFVDADKTFPGTIEALQKIEIYRSDKQKEVNEISLFKEENLNIDSREVVIPESLVNFESLSEEVKSREDVQELVKFIKEEMTTIRNNNE